MRCPDNVLIRSSFLQTSKEITGAKKGEILRSHFLSGFLICLTGSQQATVPSHCSFLENVQLLYSVYISALRTQKVWAGSTCILHVYEELLCTTV
jgi:hypothetical protein